jgi:hypothetical protein
MKINLQPAHLDESYRAACAPSPLRTWRDINNSRSAGRQPSIMHMIRPRANPTGSGWGTYMYGIVRPGGRVVS